MPNKYSSIALLLPIVIRCQGSTSSSSIMLPNLGPDTNYQINSPPVDESVRRTLQYYTIVFSASGLFVLLCMVLLTSAEFFRSKKTLAAIVPGPNTDGDDDDNDGDEEEMEEGLEQDDEDRNALNRAVLDRMMEMQRAAQVDCASQCEDPAKETELLSLKRKLRVKKRKIITAQSMADVAESGSNRPVLPAHLSLPHLSHANPYKLNSLLLKDSTPLKVTKLEVINYTDSGKGHNVSSLFDSPTTECRSTGSFLDGPTPIHTKLALLKPTEKGMRTDNEGLIMLKSVVEGNRSGLGVWCQATVVRVNAARSVQGVVSSSTYDIQYDDGKVEKGVDIGFLRARDPLTSTSTMTDINCSVQEVIPATCHTGTPSKYAQDKAGKCVGTDGNDKSEGKRLNAENADESNARCTAATPSATATATSENILDDNTAKDGLNRLPVPSNCPPPSAILSSALATGATPKTTSTARAVSYSHSSSRRVATSNGDSNKGTGSVVRASDQQASSRQSEANKINRQSYPSLKEPQYDSDREFTIASFKAPVKSSDRASDVSREVVKRPQRGREQLKDFFRDSTKDPVKEPVKSPSRSSEIIKEPSLEQTQGQETIMRAADTDADTDAAQGKRIEASEGQSNSNHIKTTEQAMKGQQQLSSSMLQSPPTFSSNKPTLRDGAEVLRANATSTGEIGEIVELRDQIPIIKQEGKSVAIPLNIIKKSTTSVAVDADEMEVGSYVEGNYADIGEWFTGRISKKWKDGSYDIQYDDGDREVGVRPPLLRLLSRAP